MACSCGAELELGDSEDNSNDTLVTLWGHQFAQAHMPCGFMSQPMINTDDEDTKHFDMRKDKREKEL
jgi:hypothetical protein